MKKTNKYKMDDSAWKEVLEHHLVDFYTTKMYEMSLSELQKEAELVGFDITKLFED